MFFKSTRWLHFLDYYHVLLLVINHNLRLHRRACISVFCRRTSIRDGASYLIYLTYNVWILTILLLRIQNLIHLLRLMTFCRNFRVNNFGWRWLKSLVSIVCLSHCRNLNFRLSEYFLSISYHCFMNCFLSIGIIRTWWRSNILLVLHLNRSYIC
jgi:hypothetical protein